MVGAVGEVEVKLTCSLDRVESTCYHEIYWSKVLKKIEYRTHHYIVTPQSVNDHSFLNT